jgi:serine protease Do
MKLSMDKSLAAIAVVGLALAMAPGHVVAGPQQKLKVKTDSDVIVVRADDSGLECDVEALEHCINDRIARKLAEVHARTALAQDQLAARLAKHHAELAVRLEKQLSSLHSKRAMMEAHAQEAAARVQADVLRAQEGLAQALTLTQDSESGWLGVQIAEVTSEKMKELKLAAERGVLITEVETDSPAAKAGLKANDVITEFNGQRIEGTAQFRRMVRETPSGRSVQLTVWREGRSQQITAQLGDWSDRLRRDVRILAPREFEFRMDPPAIFSFSSRTPRLGISGDDLSGQLGNYFGAPDGEGILIREVTSGGAAEKAGLKAGDVIIKLDGERVRSLSDLRTKLNDKRDKKTVAVTVLRKGAETTLNVDIEQPRPPQRRTLSRRITL